MKPKSWEHARIACLVRDGYLCQICKVADATDADHIWPRAAGGQDDLENLQAACGPCNKRKGDRYDLANATMQQLLWLQNRNNEKLAEANRAVWETRHLIETHGAGLSASPRRTVMRITEDHVLDQNAPAARTFSMLTRRNWVGNSYAAVTVDQILGTAAEVRRFAEDDHTLLTDECAAAEALAAEMAAAGDDSLGTYLERVGVTRRTAIEALTGLDIFDTFFGSGVPS